MASDVIKIFSNLRACFPFANRRYIRLFIFAIVIIFLLTINAIFGPSYNPSEQEDPPEINDEILHSNHFTVSSSLKQELVLETVTLPHEWPSTESFDNWFSHGELSKDAHFKPIKFDVVYTWVNGSELRHQRTREYFQSLSPLYNSYRGKGSNKKLLNPVPIGRVGPMSGSNSRMNLAKKVAKRYRDLDELRYSIRSSHKYLGDHLGQIVIVTTDFPIPGKNENIRAGQIPRWLDPSYVNPSTNQSAVRMVHHSQIFTDPTSSVPSFSSLAIESQLGRISDLSEQIVYLNDDVFLGSHFAPPDLWTPMFGFVFHIEEGLLVNPIYNPSEDNDIVGGEWAPLKYSNMVLSKRFGLRHRVYIAHIHHIMAPQILNEIVAEFPNEIKNTSSHRFRAEGDDIHIPFMFTQYVIEKHREALLYSYLVLKSDENQDGFWQWEERQRILGLIDKWQGRSIAESPPLFHQPPRYTLTDWATKLSAAGIPTTESTEYAWTSMDGFPFQQLTHNRYGERIDDSADREYYGTLETPEDRLCAIDIWHCFGDEFLNSSISTIPVSIDRIAFQDVSCGDCLIAMLTAESGDRGMEAFLPSPNATALKRHRHPKPPRPDVAEDLSLRQEAIVRIGRYGYTIGRSAFSFVYLRQPIEARIQLETLLRWQHPEFADTWADSTSPNPDDRPTAVFCLNDDFDAENPAQASMMQRYVKEFLEEWFPQRSEWELWWWKRKEGVKPIYNLKGIQKKAPEILAEGWEKGFWKNLWEGLFGKDDDEMMHALISTNEEGERTEDDGLKILK